MVTEQELATRVRDARLDLETLGTDEVSAGMREMLVLLGDLIEYILGRNVPNDGRLMTVRVSLPDGVSEVSDSLFRHSAGDGTAETSHGPDPLPPATQGTQSDTPPPPKPA